MRLKHLLTLSVIAICSMTMSTQASAETVAVGKAPQLLPWDSGTQSGTFVRLGDRGKTGTISASAVNSTFDWDINVAEGGTYLIYLPITMKQKGSNQGYNAITAFVDDVEQTDFNGDTDYIKNNGGNWQRFFTMRPFKITLPQGEHKLQLKVLNDRWYLNPDDDPRIMSADYTNAITEDGGSVLHLYTLPGSTIPYTAVDFGSIKGDNKGMLVTSTASTKVDNDYSPWEKTKIYYPVSVSKKGMYPVTVQGNFYLAPQWGETGVKPTFTINVKKASSVDGATTDLGVISNFAMVDDGANLSEGSGVLKLESGNYLLEISSDFADADLFFLKEMTVGELSTDALLLLNAPEAFLGHGFTLSGTIVNAPEDDFQVKIYLDKDGEQSLIGTATVNDTKDAFELTVSDEQSLELFPTVGDYKFVARMESGNESIAEGSTIATFAKKTFIFKTYSGQSQTEFNITYTDNAYKFNNGEKYINDVPENEMVTFKIKANVDGYFIKKVSIANYDSDDWTVYEVTQSDDDWTQLLPGNNFGEFMTLDAATGELTFTILADRSYKFSAEAGKYNLPIMVKEDGMAANGNYGVINHGTTDNWRQGGYNFTDPEDGISVWRRNVDYGMTFDIAFTDVKEGVTLSRLLDFDNEISFDTYDTKTVGKTDYTPCYYLEVKMDKAHKLHAIYAYDNLTATTKRTGNGTIAFSRNDGAEDTDDSVAKGEAGDNGVIEDTYTFKGVEHGMPSLKLNVAPDEDYLLIDVKATKDAALFPIEGEEGAYTVIVKGANPTVEAVFVRANYNVTLTAPEVGGDVEVAETVGYGEDLDIKVTPTEGYLVTSFVVNGDEQLDTPTAEAVEYTVVNVTDDVTVEVEFEKITFEVNTMLLSDKGGTVTTNAVENRIAYGDDLNITLTPDEGYDVKSLSVNSTAVDFTPEENGVVTYTLPAVKANVDIEAEFEAKTFTVTATVDGANGTIEAPENVKFGEEFKVTATPAEGYHVESLKVNGQSVDFTPESDGKVVYTVTDATGDIEIVAAFDINVYSINATAEGSGKVTVKIDGQDSDATSVNHGQKVEIIATPNDTYVITNITVNGSQLTNINEMGHTHTIESATGDITFTATFDKGNGISRMLDDNASYKVFNGGILVRTVVKSDVRLVDLTGRTIFIGTVDGEAFIETSAKGVVIIIIDGKPYKVTL